MKGGLSSDASSDDIKKYFDACRFAAADLKIDLFIDDGLPMIQAAGVIRASVLEMIGSINETLAVGLSRGYLLPSSPFPDIEQINATRRLFDPLTWTYNAAILKYNAAVELAQIAAKYKAGQITFDRKPAAQISSYEVSVDGISSQSGDPLADILGYQPDGDFIKRKQALDSLAKLDFSRRKPYLLFTMEGRDGGIVVCWGRMRDASGYVVSRRDVFNDQDLPEIVKTNGQLVESTKDLLKDDRFYQTLSFYDWTTAQDVWAFVDDAVSSDTLYSYKIAGTQMKAPASPFIFDVPANALFFSPAIADAAQKALIEEATRFNHDPMTISPYPAISQAVYGDQSYGWVIAGCNLLASVRRGDQVDSVRANSYIGSNADRIFTEARAGRLFIPSDISKVQQNVENAISAYGISQTILSLLDGTGMTHFISGKDDPHGIQPTQASIEGSTSGLARILSVIDPETATLDPKLITVAARPVTALRGTSFSVQMLNLQTGPSLEEILGEGVIDLTTYAGIARLMQLLRSMYDFYPGVFS
jgi:hypothetical protein